jgi:hypothetical protein
MIYSTRFTATAPYFEGLLRPGLVSGVARDDVSGLDVRFDDRPENLPQDPEKLESAPGIEMALDASVRSDAVREPALAFDRPEPGHEVHALDDRQAAAEPESCHPRESWGPAMAGEELPGKTARLELDVRFRGNDTGPQERTSEPTSATADRLDCHSGSMPGSRASPAAGSMRWPGVDRAWRLASQN